MSGLLFLILFTLQAKADTESFIYPNMSAEALMSGIAQDASLNLVNTPCSQKQALIQELKTEEDPECQVYLGWGHVRNSHELINRLNGQGIGMGCSAGESTLGEVPGSYGRFQRGSNGTYANERNQGTQNGGLNPVILPDIASKNLRDHNSYIGFMRLTQYHWLQLVNYSKDHLLGKKCSSVKLKFVCSDNSFNDLNNLEFNKRMSAASKNKIFLKDKVFSSKEDKNLKNEIEILQRFERLKGCFNNKATSLPKRCDHEIVIDQETQMAKHCQDWVKEIETVKQLDWSSPSSLERPETYPYPKTGKLH
jgi:hypothetical protein